ncbi:hypothetical protein F7R91_22740 [Streptomyces luteolifulvus]|jgi:hypothetical protein|uniref:Lipoprotein n=1 Tax=Streptomyces luteolifulvus TaxID=2615112 RepID=A0A6H9UVL8_9ACTN|nr:hypothetical protein [Streptomyces luteolifulvus]KAB1144178.1 hypothetical protein F7R91_22740 [Streptomyces luteolifulvus]
MRTTRQRTAAAGLLVAVAISVTGCSSDSDDGSGGEKIEGAGSGKSASPSSTASEPAEKNAPTFAFPSDLRVSVERDQTGDATKDAILRDAAYSAQANIEAFAKGDAKSANLSRYLGGSAFTYWSQQVADFKKDGLTLTGEYRYYDFKVTDVANAKTAAATYCEDQSKAFSKEIKSKKVLRTKASDKSYVLYTLQVAKDAAGDWQVTQQSWKKGDASCVQG